MHGKFSDLGNISNKLIYFSSVNEIFWRLLIYKEDFCWGKAMDSLENLSLWNDIVSLRKRPCAKNMFFC